MTSKLQLLALHGDSVLGGREGLVYCLMWDQSNDTNNSSTLFYCEATGN